MGRNIKDFTGLIVNDYEFIRTSTTRKRRRIQWVIKCLRCGSLLDGVLHVTPKRKTVTPRCECRAITHLTIGQQINGRKILELKGGKARTLCVKCGEENWINRSTVVYISKDKECHKCCTKLNRNRAIATLHLAGFTNRSIADVLGMTYQRVQQIIKREVTEC